MTREVKLRVLVVDDNQLTRLGIRGLLETQDGIEIVGEAEDGSQALALYRQTQPDAVICDLRMPHFDGVRTIELLRKEPLAARVLVLTNFDGENDVFAAVQAGALGFLTKEARGTEILAALHAVAAGQKVIPPVLADRLANRQQRPSLTVRERDVLTFIFRGHSNREIALAMKLADKTIEMYVSSLLAKLEAKSRTEAVSIALARGLISK
ncbi:MAG: response regulator transcription factor [Deltaproteobacteria bacterium]|nr:response regulator transcription factor [Deltaproteobacteria bacterium]